MGKAKKINAKKPQSQPYRRNKGTEKKSTGPAKKVQKKTSQFEIASGSSSQPVPPGGIPFKEEDRILLVGEGDFSFTYSLHAHHGFTSLTATTFESRPSLLSKYPQAADIISEIESEGSHTILYSIDATKLGAPHTPGASALRKSRYDAIVFNFPHVGGKSTDVNRQVRANQDLVVKFLESAKQLLVEGGKIVLTIFEGQPYELWGVRNLARHVGLKVERSMRFDAGLYPGYSHARTLGNIEGGGGWKGEERKARTFLFTTEGAFANMPKKRRTADSDDEE